MARRAASISRAVMRARLVAFRPNSPKETLLPRSARPAFLPLNCFRYLVRLGCNTAFNSCARLFGGGGRYRYRDRGRGGLGVDCHLDLRLLEHFALEDPYLHADDAVGGTGFG